MNCINENNLPENIPVAYLNCTIKIKYHEKQINLLLTRVCLAYTPDPLYAKIFQHFWTESCIVNAYGF